MKKQISESIKLYIKQYQFLRTGRTNVYNEKGRIKYYTLGEGDALGGRIVIKDMNENELARIEFKNEGFCVWCRIIQSGIVMVSIGKENITSDGRCFLRELDWIIEEKNYGGSFLFTRDGFKIGTVIKTRVAGNVAAEFNIDSMTDDTLILAVAFAAEGLFGE